MWIFRFSTWYHARGHGRFLRSLTFDRALLLFDGLDALRCCLSLSTVCRVGSFKLGYPLCHGRHAALQRGEDLVLEWWRLLLWIFVDPFHYYVVIFSCHRCRDLHVHVRRFFCYLQGELEKRPTNGNVLRAYIGMITSQTYHIHDISN